jgi:hypothetical protein
MPVHQQDRRAVASLAALHDGVRPTSSGVAMSTCRAGSAKTEVPPQRLWRSGTSCKTGSRMRRSPRSRLRQRVGTDKMEVRQDDSGSPWAGAGPRRTQVRAAPCERDCRALGYSAA